MGIILTWILRFFDLFVAMCNHMVSSFSQIQTGNRELTWTSRTTSPTPPNRLASLPGLLAVVHSSSWQGHGLHVSSARHRLRLYCYICNDISLVTRALAIFPHDRLCGRFINEFHTTHSLQPIYLLSLSFPIHYATCTLSSTVLERSTLYHISF